MNVKHLLMITAMLFAAHAYAHAMLESSSPANHAVMNAAPKTLDLKFGHPARLTKLKLSGAWKEAPLAVDLSAPATTSFSVPLPPLAPGSYEVKWGTLAGDGHAMSGRLSFTVSGK